MGINKIIRVPIFYEDDPEEWVSWVERYFSDHGFSEQEKRPFVYGFVEGDARSWFERQDSMDPFKSWEAIKAGLLARFGNDKDRELAKIKKRLDILERLERRMIEDEERRSRGKGKVQEEETQNSEMDDETIIGSHSRFQANCSKGPRVGSEVKKEPLMRKIEIPVFDDEDSPILEGKKRTEGEKAEPVCQVFEQMSVREGKTKKKKKRWKKLSKKRFCIKFNWLHYKCRNQNRENLLRNRSKKRRMKSFVFYDIVLGQGFYTRQVFDKKSLLIFTVKNEMRT